MSLKSRIYDAALLPLTTGWYRTVLERLPDDARLLDIGIGTAGALCANASLIQSKNLTVLGVDIDAAYIDRAQVLIRESGLTDRVEARLQSVYDCDDQPFDAVYFSASFMLLPDPVQALTQVMGQLAPEGRVYFTQTFQERRSRFLEHAKPLLRRLTTIDFGTVTYENDFRETVGRADCELLDMVQMGRTGGRSYRMVVGRPIA